MYQAQQPYGDGSYIAWQTDYGNLQGNFGAATGLNSYQPGANGYHVPPGGHPNSFGQYGRYPPPGGWQHPYADYSNQQYQIHGGAYPCTIAITSGPPELLPPLPEDTPPPPPPPPAEDFPPLPPDALPAMPESQPQGPLAPPPTGPVNAWVPTYYPHQPHMTSWPQPYSHNPFYQQPYHTQQPQHSASSATGQPYPPPYHTYPHPQGPPDGYSAAPSHPSQKPLGALPPGPVLYPPPPPSLPTSMTAGAQMPTHGAAFTPVPYLGTGASVDSAPPQIQPTMVLQPPCAGPADAVAASPVISPVVVDITRLLRTPHRSTRPRKLLLVLRGLPGSGKSSLVRKIREAELEVGSEAPRVHSIDDYYMQEVEVEVVEDEAGRKKRRKVTEMKYLYEPEMEGTYFRELVRTVGRSCEDRRNNFVVVDAPVLRNEQLRELMAAGQRANFECFVLRPLETNPVVCGSPNRNLHGHSLETLRQMADSFEEAPPLYTQVSAVSLFGGPVVGEETKRASVEGRGAAHDITEVEMDEGEDSDGEDEAGVGHRRCGVEEDGHGDGEDLSPRHQLTSRWHVDGDEVGGEAGGADNPGKKKRRKRDKAKAVQAAARVDEAGALSGRNDSMAAGATEAGPGLATATLWSKRCGPLRSALKRSLAWVAEAFGGKSGPRRVRWPDLAQDTADPADSTGRHPGAGSSAAGQWEGQPLTQVVYLEGLGPAPELEDLPYGYQRKAAAASDVQDGDKPLLGGPPHHNFKEQAKAEHESEHDLFRRLMFGKQASVATATVTSSRGTALGLFERATDEEDDG